MDDEADSKKARDDIEAWHYRRWLERSRQTYAPERASVRATCERLIGYGGAVADKAREILANLET